MEDYSISPGVVSEYSVAPPAGPDGGLQHLPGGCHEYSVAPLAGADGGLQHLPGGCQ